MGRESGRKFVRQTLLRSAVLGNPVLRYLDGVEMESRTSGAVIDRHALYATRTAVESGGVQITEDQDKEFSMGLRGERDVTAVA